MYKKILVVIGILFLTFAARQEVSPGMELSNGLFLHQNGNVVNLVLSKSEKAKLLDGEVNNRILTEKVYKTFGDSFDFIFFLYDDFRKPDSLYYGKCFPTQNNTKGIGKKIFDKSRDYGSEGRLKGIIHLTRNTAIREGPILHELMHVWANEYLQTSIDGHWGYTGVGGQLGGFQRLVHLRDEYYKGFVEGHTGFSLESNWGNTTPYSPLELYLMGLLPPEEVPPLQIAVNAEGNPSYNGLFTAERIDTICMEDLIEIHGKRVPSSYESQDSFRGIIVLVSDAPVSRYLFDQVSADAYQFSLTGPPARNWRAKPNWWGKENFFTATRGLGCLQLGELEDALRPEPLERGISLR